MTKKSLILGTSTLAIALSASVAVAEVNQPQEIIMRPMTTPASQITVGGDLLLGFDPTVIGLGLGGAFGVSDKLEVNANYLFSLEEFEAKGDLSFEGAFNIMEGNLGVAAQARLGYNLLFEKLDPIGLGARVRFRLNDQMAIYSPGNQVVIGIAETEIGPVTIKDGSYFQAPVGFAFQLSPQLYAFAATNIAQIEISDSDTGFIFADFIPLELGAFFSPSNTMDLGASIDLGDLKADEIDFFIGLHARLHM